MVVYKNSIVGTEMLKVNLLGKLINKIKNPLTREENILLHDLSNNYKISNKVVWYYRNKVKEKSKEHEQYTYSEVKNKIIRNIVLGKIINEVKNVRTYRYGNLIIGIDTNQFNVFRMDNRKGYCVFNVDEEKRKYLDRRLHIK